MSNKSIHRRRRTGMLPSMGFGLFIGVLMTSLSAPLRVLVVGGTGPAKAGTSKDQSATPAALCVSDRGDRQPHQSDMRESRRMIGLRVSMLGMHNVKRLLPVARCLTTEALRETGLRYGVPACKIREAQRQVISARRVTLDRRLSDSAMVDDRRPSEIRIGPICAAALVSDDAAVFILAHELTHLGNSKGDLQALAGDVSRDARSIACVIATDRQQEDLACDFIAEVVLRRFVANRPTGKSAEERLCLTLAGGNSDDKTHLSDAETLRALIALDPQLRLLLMKWLGGRRTDEHSIVVEPLAME